jgi:hypothetical protein
VPGCAQERLRALVRADEGFTKAKCDAKWHPREIKRDSGIGEDLEGQHVLATWSLRGGLLFVSSDVVLLQSIRVLRLANA